MDRFEQVSLEKGCRLVSLATFGAKGFYEKLGYDTRAGYFKKYLEYPPNDEASFQSWDPEIDVFPDIVEIRK